MVSQVQAKEVYNRHYAAAEQVLSKYPDGFSKNQAITYFYHQISLQYPQMQWFSIAMLASSAVGKAIAITGKMSQRIGSVLGDLGMAGEMGAFIPLLYPEDEPSDFFQKQILTLHEGLCYGNQVIFKNIFATLHTYMELGIKGLRQVQSYDASIPGNEVAITDDILFAFIGMEANYYNPIIHQAFQNQWDNKFAFSPEAVKLLAEVAYYFTAHEQRIVAAMYRMRPENSDVTVGELLAAAVNDPVMSSFLEALKLSGPTIAGRYVPFTMKHGDITSYEDRMDYFEKELSNTYFGILQTPGGARRLAYDRDAITLEFDIDYRFVSVPYVYRENPFANMLQVWHDWSQYPNKFNEPLEAILYDNNYKTFLGAQNSFAIEKNAEDGPLGSVEHYFSSLHEGLDVNQQEAVGLLKAYMQEIDERTLQASYVSEPEIDIPMSYFG